MKKKPSIKNILLQKGYFPEVLPPCFDSTDLVRAFSGLAKDLKKAQFNQRSSSYIRYSGTKHDGNRRNYGTVNPVPYFQVCGFISEKWSELSVKINSSDFGLSSINLGGADSDRALFVPALSEVTAKLSKKIKYAPYIIKTDIAQFFPSIYTHSISWVAHGIQQSKDDTSRKSDKNYFNRLDWFTQQCQNSQTRGVVIGPDAFRLIAEFIACEIDEQLKNRAGASIVGAVRHVDDFYIGIRSEFDGAIVLSQLREILQDYELQINDSKTKVLVGLQPVDDLWAQELRLLKMHNEASINYALDKAFEISQKVGSQSPMKVVIRRLDKEKCYSKNNLWAEIEPKLQRILFHYSHCLDYVCLLVVKRFAIKEPIDYSSWSTITSLLLERYIGTNQHHEIVWLTWLMMVCKLNIPNELASKLTKVQNSHIKALLIAGFKEGYLPVRPDLKLGGKLSTTDENWLHNLVGRAMGFTGAPFTGDFTQEFEHLARKKVKLINFKKHLKAMSAKKAAAISKTRYGYDADEDWEESDDDDDDDERKILRSFPDHEEFDWDSLPDI